MTGFISNSDCCNITSNSYSNGAKQAQSQCEMALQKVCDAKED